MCFRVPPYWWCFSSTFESWRCLFFARNLFLKEITSNWRKTLMQKDSSEWKQHHKIKREATKFKTDVNIWQANITSHFTFIASCWMYTCIFSAAIVIVCCTMTTMKFFDRSRRSKLRRQHQQQCSKKSCWIWIKQ